MPSPLGQCQPSGGLAVALDTAIDVIQRVRAEVPDTRRWLLSVSLNDCVMIDVIRRAGVDCPIVFVDTGFHFPQTLGYLSVVERHFGISISRLTAGGTDLPHSTTPDACCGRRKVAPLQAHLADCAVWLTGVRRADSPVRSAAPALRRDLDLGLLKVSPIVSWTDAQVDEYVRTRRLPRNPLTAAGFASIGCAPCTARSQPGPGRAGRWPGTERTECGLHREFVDVPTSPSSPTQLVPDPGISLPPT